MRADGKTLDIKVSLQLIELVIHASNVGRKFFVLLGTAVMNLITCTHGSQADYVGKGALRCRPKKQMIKKRRTKACKISF